MLNKMLDQSQFKDFMVVRRVGPQMFRQAVYSFLRYFDEIHNAVFAMYGAFTAAVSIELPGYDAEANLRQGTSALKKFRGFPDPQDREDFEARLWLGTSLLIHANCALGSIASPVRRYMLSYLNRLGEHGKQFRSHPVIVSLTALDIYECLLYRQMPIMNVPDSDLIDSDCFLSLCTPLLRFACRPCEINSSTATPSRESSVLEVYSENALHELEYSVEAWQPDFTSKPNSKLGIVEAKHVITQYRVHKTMILLFIHRLRYPFGVRDVQAEQMAESIFSELDLGTFATGEAPLMVTTPFLVAAIEAIWPSDKDKIIRDIAVYTDRLSPKSRETFRSFLEALWDTRDRQPGFRWIDMMAYLPTVCVSI